MKKQFIFIFILFIFTLLNCKPKEVSIISELDFDTKNTILLANEYLKQKPVTVTDFVAERSVGGIHDFYSEGDYWWPNPEDPDGVYIRRDGKTNPDNFTAHRQAMRNLNKWVSVLVAAYKITKKEKYALHAYKHLDAFFLNPATLMNPNLLYAQAIKGKVTGRGIGIIDTIHLIEIAKAIEQLMTAGFFKKEQFEALKKWFDQYATWMNTHPYGLKEKNHGNNHSTWWAAQIAAFAHLAEREDLMEVARQQFKILLSNQMAADGSFPDELSRSKPYNYSLFNLEGYATLCKIASTSKENLWTYKSKNGSIFKAWNFMVPFIKDKSSWTKRPDVQYFDQLPIQSTGLLLAALAYKNEDFIEVWKRLNPIRKSMEIDRNFPIREPILWVK